MGRMAQKQAVLLDPHHFDQHVTHANDGEVQPSDPRQPGVPPQSRQEQEKNSAENIRVQTISSATSMAATKPMATWSRRKGLMALVEVKYLF